MAASIKMWIWEIEIGQEKSFIFIFIAITENYPTN